MDLTLGEAVMEDIESQETLNEEILASASTVSPSWLTSVKDLICFPELTKLLTRLKDCICFPELTILLTRLKEIICAPEVIIWLKRAKILICDIGLFLTDFISDIVNGVHLYKTGHPVWASFSLGLTVFPTLVLGLGQYLLNRDLTLFMASLLLGWVYVPIQTIRGYV